MLITHKLPLSFDAARLQADLGGLSADDWTPHFNQDYYEGEWKGLALCSTTGRANQLTWLPTDAPFATETPLLTRCPYFREVLGAFKCQFTGARLLSLSPGSKILEHCDYFLGLQYGTLRIHVPVTTDSRVDFVVNHERLEMQAGEVWYIDFTRPHSVNNYSDRERVHLVVDCTVNDWLVSMMPFSEEELARRNKTTFV